MKLEDNVPLVALMKEADVSNAQIAMIFGVTRSAVEKFNQRHGLTSRRSATRRAQIPDPDIEEAWHLLGDEASDKAVAHALGCARSTVANWRRRNGIAGNPPPKLSVRRWELDLAVRHLTNAMHDESVPRNAKAYIEAALKELKVNND